MKIKNHPRGNDDKTLAGFENKLITDKVTVPEVMRLFKRLTNENVLFGGWCWQHPEMVPSAAGERWDMRLDQIVESIVLKANEKENSTIDAAMAMERCFLGKVGVIGEYNQYPDEEEEES